MKFFFPIFIILIYGCASSIPDGYVQSLAHMSEELEKTKAIANEAIDKVNRLEKMLSESISDRDSMLYEHKKETALLRASDAFHKGNNALLTKNYDKAILYYIKTIEFRPSDAHAYNNLGNAYKEIENYSKAIDAYNNAIGLKPDYASAYYNLGIVYQKDNDFDTALESYKKAARLAHSGVQKWLKDGGYYWQNNTQSE